MGRRRTGGLGRCLHVGGDEDQSLLLFLIVLLRKSLPSSSLASGKRRGDCRCGRPVRCLVGWRKAWESGVGGRSSFIFRSSSSSRPPRGSLLPSFLAWKKRKPKKRVRGRRREEGTAAKNERRGIVCEVGGGRSPRDRGKRRRKGLPGFARV